MEISEAPASETTPLHPHRVNADVVDSEDEDAGEDSADSELKPEPNKPPPPRKRKGFSLSFILNTLTLGLGSWAAYTQWEKHIAQPSLQFIGGLVCGAWTGLTLTRRYKASKRLTERRKHILNLSFRRSHLRNVLKRTPYWLDFAETENADSLNRLVHQMWRHYETAICKQISALVEPLLMSHKPMFVNSIKFSKLTFGDAPFKVTHISILKETTEELVLEMGIRWDGTACVAIAVDILGAGTITPSIKRLNFFANLRISLTRMVPKIPGFGAMLLSFKSPPFVTFDIDCGPGIGEMITAWLIPFLKNELLGNLLVWPNRIVIPLLPPDVIGPINNLSLHTRGVLKVEVIEATGLPKTDFIGKGDPFALLETVPFKPVQTKFVKNTDQPKWNETHYLIVQEVDQNLRVTVRDQESAIIGALTLQTSELQGRTMISIENIPIGERVDEWYDLGNKDWGDIDGPGTGCGQIHLALTYYTLEALRDGQFEVQTNSTVAKGLVFVNVRLGNNLSSLKGTTPPNPYCVVWLADVSKTTRTLKNTRDPIWNESMDWSNVAVTETLYIEVYDHGSVSDNLLGKTKTSLLSIAKEFADGRAQGPIECTLELEGHRGDVVVLVEWIPLDKIPLPFRSVKSRDMSSLDVSRRGTLFVRLLSGEGLKNVDIVGLSDPYCVLKIGGSPKVSKYIDNNLNPVWKESFKWNGVRQNAILHIKVFDKGTINDRSLGVCQVKIESASDPPGIVYSFTLDLKHKRTGVPVQGKINLQMCWKHWTRDSEDDVPDAPEWPDFNNIVIEGS